MSVSWCVAWNYVQHRCVCVVYISQTIANIYVRVCACVSYCVERNLWPGRMLHICKLTISFKFHARRRNNKVLACWGNQSHMSLMSVRVPLWLYICRPPMAIQNQLNMTAFWNFTWFIITHTNRNSNTNTNMSMSRRHTTHTTNTQILVEPQNIGQRLEPLACDSIGWQMQFNEQQIWPII